MELTVWLGTSTGLFVVGIGLLFLGYNFLKLGLDSGTRKLLKYGGFGAIIWALAIYGGFTLVGEEEAPIAVTVGAFDVTTSEAMSWLTVNNQAQTVTWAVTYNYTSADFTGVGGAAGGAGAESNSQYALLSFSVDRGLGTVGLVQTYGEVSSVPSISNDTTGDTHSILTKSDDQYNAIWTRADSTTAYEMITVTIAETADGAVVTLNMTLASAAVGSMEQFDTANIGLVIGGESWAVTVLLANVS